MREAMELLLPKMLSGPAAAFRIIDHGSKSRLLVDLPDRLKGYRGRVPENIRVVVLVDRDADDCRVLKARLETAAVVAGIATKTLPDAQAKFQVLNRVVIEELEAWFFGDVPAIQAAYPGVSATLGNKARFREPDAVAGGTWEALLRVLQQAGHYRGQRSLPKIEVARRVAGHMDPRRNRSRSFRTFADGLERLMSQPVIPG